MPIPALDLSEARALIVGVGGLGCPAALALTEAGVGTLGLADGDVVEVSNLHRQILHRVSTLGEPKVRSAKGALRAEARGLNVEIYPMALGRAEMEALFQDYDVVLDAVDAAETKDLVHDAAFAAGTPLVHGGAVGLRGQAATILPGKTACLRCAFPGARDEGGPTCAQDGVLGAVPGVIGAILAAETLALLREGRSPLSGALMTLDARAGTMRRAALRRDPDCPLCGRAPSAETVESQTRREASSNV